MPVDQRFQPHIAKLQDGQFSGSYFKSLEVKEMQTSAPVIYSKEENLFDHFKLAIPYAGFTLVWEVRFDSNCPEQAPDFLFDDDSFTLFLDAELVSERVPSLDRWNIEDPECLSSVVQELLNLYTTYQLQRLEGNGSSLPEECSKVIQEFDLEEAQIQVLAGSSPSLPQYHGSSRPPLNAVSVLFLQLEKQLAFDNIPEIYRQMSLQFLTREYSPTNVVLHISPVLEDILSERGDLEIPNYTKSDGFSKYFHQILNVVHKTLDQVNNCHQKRQEFHLNLLYELQECKLIHEVILLETDIPNFTSSSYMIDVEDFPIMMIAQTPIIGSGDPKVTIQTITGDRKSVV